jgi:hypothetical protein
MKSSFSLCVFMSPSKFLVSCEVSVMSKANRLLVLPGSYYYLTVFYV